MDSGGEARDVLIETLRRALESRKDVRLAMLFGSRARDRARPESDVDLAVEAPGVDLWTLAADLSQAVGLEVDLVNLREAGYPLLKSVAGVSPAWWPESLSSACSPPSEIPQSWERRRLACMVAGAAELACSPPPEITGSWECSQQADATFALSA